MQFKADWISDIKNSEGYLKASDEIMNKLDNEIEQCIERLKMLNFKRKILAERIVTVTEYSEIGKQLLNINRN